MVIPTLLASSQTNQESVVSLETAKQIRDILKDVVKKSTGIKAQYPGLEIAGKTGTAHIAKNGKYAREYHSSFYGFANDDKDHKYTIGVMVIRAKAKYAYFASQSAVPVFKEVVDSMVDLGYLKVKKGEETYQCTIRETLDLLTRERTNNIDEDIKVFFKIGVNEVAMVIPGLSKPLLYLASSKDESDPSIKMDYYDGESCTLIAYDNFMTGAKIFTKKQIMTLVSCDIVD